MIAQTCYTKAIKNAVRVLQTPTALAYREASMNSVPLRRCSKCKQEFPATLEHFGADRRGKFGLRSICRNCLSQYNKEWWRDNPDKRLQYQESGRDSHRVSALKYARKLYEQNPEYYKRDYSLNKERYKRAAYRWRAKNPEIARKKLKTVFQ